MNDIDRAYSVVKDDLANYVFVNFPYEQEIIESKLNEWKQELLVEIESNLYSPTTAYIAEVPKPNWAIRPGTILTIKDHVAYTSFVNDCFAQLHSTLIWSQNEIDFAYRLNQDTTSTSWFYGQYLGWKAFKEKGLELLTQGYSHVVFTDITGFYENIDHSLLLSDLRQIAAPNNAIENIRQCLKHWSHVGTKGIPQGSCASHLLAKLYLNVVDQKLKDMGYVHQHYSDDFRIFCNSFTEAKEVLSKLTELLRKRGLNLQSAKSKILKADDAKSEIEGAATLVENVNQKIILELDETYDSPYQANYIVNTQSLNQKQIETIKTTFADNFINDSSGNFNKSLFHYLLNKLAGANNDFAVNYCITALTKQPQETADILKYFTKCNIGRETQDKVLDFIDKEGSIYDYQNFQIMQWLFEQDYQGDLINKARAVAFDNNKPIYYRALAKQILGSRGSSADLERLHESYDNTVTEVEKASLICSIHSLESGRRNTFYRKPELANGLLKFAVSFAKNIQ